MSIIHDALKKVQQSLDPKTDETQIRSSAVTETGPAYLYETPKIEDLPQAGQQTANKESPMKNKIKSTLVLSAAIVITVASALYIYQQFQNDIPKINSFAKKSFYKLINKEEPLAFANKAPGDLKALAQLTINPSAGSKMANPPAPIILNIHGVMSNGSNNLVLINDQVYQEGDEVDGAKIVKINLNSITVINNGVEQTIPVKN